MGFKTLSISLIKYLITIISISLIFSYTAYDLNKVMQESLADIYKFSSENSKATMLEFLGKSCKSFSEGDVVTVNQICSNQTMLESYKENCAEYRKLKKQGRIIKNEGEMEESCRNIESGGLERQCGKLKGSSAISDINQLKELCSDYSTGKISAGEFFASSITQSFGKIENIDSPFFNKYHKYITFLQSNILLLIISTAILFVLLFILIYDIPIFLLTIAKICLSISITILLPYAAVLAYDNIIGINTSPILDAMLSGQPSFEPSSLASLMLLMVLKTYNPLILILGIALLIIGILGKIYSIIRKRQVKSP